MNQNGFRKRWGVGGEIHSTLKRLRFKDFEFRNDYNFSLSQNLWIMTFFQYGLGLRPRPDNQQSDLFKNVYLKCESENFSFCSRL